MEKAASLCGVLSPGIIHEKGMRVYESRRNDKIEKIVKQQIAEGFVIEAEEEQAKLMLKFGEKILSWLIDETTHEIRNM